MPTSDQAICLRTTDYSETSQVLGLLTRAGGLVRLLAKGSKRPKSTSGGSIDLFAEGRCVYAGGARESLGTLMEFAESRSHGRLRSGLGRLHAGLHMLELCGALLAENDPHPEVFDLLHNALARLDEPDAPAPAVLAYFQVRLLKRVGLLGGLSACAGCGAEPGAGAAFSSAAGGLLCRACQPAAADRRAVPRAALAGLGVLAAAEAGRRPAFPDDQARAVTALLDYHVEYQLGRRLRTARYVGKV